jgi:hypothetical protein
MSSLKDFNKKTNLIDTKLLEFIESKGYTLVVYKGREMCIETEQFIEILEEYIVYRRDIKLNQLLNE